MLYERAMFSNTAEPRKYCWSTFCSSRAQFGRNVVCFTCIPKVPTKDSHHRITVVSLQSFNDFHRTFLDYTGNCYKHVFMSLCSTIAEVLSICSCMSWMLCPVTLCCDLSMTAVLMALAGAVTFTHQKKHTIWLLAFTVCLLLLAVGLLTGCSVSFTR